MMLMFSILIPLFSLYFVNGFLRPYSFDWKTISSRSKLFNLDPNLISVATNTVAGVLAIGGSYPGWQAAYDKVLKSLPKSIENLKISESVSGAKFVHRPELEKKIQNIY